MDQTDAQLGQEAAPEGQINTTTPEERPASTTGSMEKLLQEEGLNLDFLVSCVVFPLSRLAYESLSLESAIRSPLVFPHGFTLEIPVLTWASPTLIRFSGLRAYSLFTDHKAMLTFFIAGLACNYGLGQFF